MMMIPAIGSAAPVKVKVTKPSGEVAYEQVIDDKGQSPEEVKQSIDDTLMKKGMVGYWVKVTPEKGAEAKPAAPAAGGETTKMGAKIVTVQAANDLLAKLKGSKELGVPAAKLHAPPQGDVLYNVYEMR